MQEILVIAGIGSMAVAGYSVTSHIGRRRFLKKRFNAFQTAQGTPKGTEPSKLFNFLDDEFNYMFSYTDSKLSPESFFTLSLVGALLGSIVGSFILNSNMTGIVLALWFGAAPTVWLQTKADHKKGKVEKVLLDFLYQFTNRYMEIRDIRLALAAMDEEDYPVIEKEVQRLKNRLNAGDSLEGSLTDFSQRVRNKWARYFADIVIMSHKTGAPLSGPVSMLIGQLQRNEKRQSQIWATLVFYKIAFAVATLFAVGSYYWLSIKIPRTFYYFTSTAMGKNMSFVSSMLLAVCFVIIMFQRR